MAYGWPVVSDGVVVRDNKQTGGSENDTGRSHIVCLKRQPAESRANIVQSQVSAATGRRGEAVVVLSSG